MSGTGNIANGKGKGKGKVYVVEHMEADESTPEALPTWVQHEYAHMLERTFHKDRGASSRVYFTNLSARSAQALTSGLTSFQSESGKSDFQATSSSVEDLVQSGKLPPRERICLLDPKAPEPILPGDAELFDCFLFGGILGDDPPRDRTKELRKLGFPSRHLREVQMTTDTAVFVTSLVIDGQTELGNIPFVDHPTIHFNAQESVEMPFRYVTDHGGEPIMPKGMKQVLYEDMNRGFDEL